MRLALCLAVLALTGCESAQQLRALAPQQTDFEICRASVLGNPTLSQVAWEERQRRQLNCSQYMAEIQTQQQAQAARAAIGLQMLQASRPQPYVAPPLPAPSPTVNCVSRPALGSVYTTCN